MPKTCHRHFHLPEIRLCRRLVLRTPPARARSASFSRTRKGIPLSMNDCVASPAFPAPQLRRMLAECAPEDHGLIVTEWTTAIEQDRSFSREFRFPTA